MRAASRRGKSRGFTLIEAMVVIGIVAILAAIAAPNMSAMIKRQRIKTAAFDVNASLIYARSEAIKRNNTVTITPVSTANWAKGWQITDGNNVVLRDQPGWDDLTMTGPTAVAFSGTGRLSGGAGAPFGLTGDDSHSSRCVTLDLSGRAVSKEGAC